MPAPTDLQIVMQGDALSIKALDYHVPPTLLNDLDLRRLGLVRDPARCGELLLDAFRLASGGTGLWIHVRDYHAKPVRLALAQLAQIGLRPIA